MFELKESLEKAISDCQHKEYECQAQVDASHMQLEQAQDAVAHLNAAVVDYEATVESLKEQIAKTREEFLVEKNRLKQELDSALAQNASLTETVEHLNAEKPKQKKKDYSPSLVVNKVEPTPPKFFQNQLENNILAAELKNALTECENLNLEIELREKRIQELLLEKTKLSVSQRKEVDRLRIQQSEEVFKLKEEIRLLTFKISMLENKVNSEPEKVPVDNMSWKPASPSNIETGDQAVKGDYGLSEKWIEDYVFNQKPLSDVNDANSSENEHIRETCIHCHTISAYRARTPLPGGESHRKDLKHRSGLCSQISTNPKKSNHKQLVDCDKSVQVDVQHLDTAASQDPKLRKLPAKRSDPSKLKYICDFLFSLPSIGILFVALLICLVFRYRRMTQVLRNKLLSQVRGV